MPPLATDPSPAEYLRVLGIDPGTLITGYAVVERRGSATILLTSGEIINTSGTPMTERLLVIHARIVSLLSKFRPHEFAIESAFYGKNAQSALKLGHARGVCLLAAAEHRLPTAEYSPREVKKAVVGNGNASKEQVRFMITSLLRLGKTPLKLDVSDAAAIALCHLQRLGTTSQRHRDWKAFVEAHPERIHR